MKLDTLVKVALNLALLAAIPVATYGDDAAKYRTLIAESQADQVVFEVEPGALLQEKDRTFIWQRPTWAVYALVAGCGGGGAGAPGNSKGGASEPKFERGAEYGPAAGGKAGEYTTVLVGPLHGDSYKILLGSGGDGGDAREFEIKKPATSGGASTFSGRDITTLSFAGGAAGAIIPAAQKKAKDEVAGHPGEDGPTPRSGGLGGAPYRNGMPATGPCAGGGGTGSNRNNNQVAKGGRGGNGKVIVYPLRRQPED